MYFPDLTPCRYGNGPCSQKSWRAPLLAIGWLEHPHPFTLGDPPAELRSRIKAVIRQNANHLHPIAFFGLHECSLCAAIRSCDSSLPGSHTNLFVPGDGVIFAAPGRVEDHRGRAPWASTRLSGCRLAQIQGGSPIGECGSYAPDLTRHAPSNKALQLPGHALIDSPLVYAGSQLRRSEISGQRGRQLSSDSLGGERTEEAR